MFINISNHPSDKWSEKQIKEIKKYDDGEIIDIPFPNINPHWNEDEVDLIVNKYFTKVMKLKEKKRKTESVYVHLMGESGFVLSLAIDLNNIFIDVLYSTTERIVTENENGEKIVKFEFVKFRRYFL
jgi:hypothetical protein